MFVVNNKSPHLIDSVVIETANLKVVFNKIEPNSSQTKNTLLTGKPPEVDGAFNTKVYQKYSAVYTGNFGYFSNGNMEHKYEIQINNDFSISETVS